MRGTSFVPGERSDRGNDLLMVMQMFCLRRGWSPPAPLHSIPLYIMARSGQATLGCAWKTLPSSSGTLGIQIVNLASVFPQIPG